MHQGFASGSAQLQARQDADGESGFSTVATCKPDNMQHLTVTQCIYISHHNTEMGQQLKIRKTTSNLQITDTATNSFQTTDNATWRERQLAKPCIPTLASDTHMIRSRTACACLRCAPIICLEEKAVVQSMCPMS